MYQAAYLSMSELVEMIDSPDRQICQQILLDNGELFRQVQGSSRNHQAWPGGYWDHVVECMNMAAVLYDTLNDLRPLGFSLSDALLVLFLHDIEKPWKYELDKNGQSQDKPELQDKAARMQFRKAKLDEYGFRLTKAQGNAMYYVEGEFKDYSNQVRRQWPLGAFVQMCDNNSGRLWPNHPLTQDDPWTGAGRVADQEHVLASNWICPTCGSDSSMLKYHTLNPGGMAGEPDISCRNCGLVIR